jgi:hypothetical protein
MFLLSLLSQRKTEAQEGEVTYPGACKQLVSWEAISAGSPSRALSTSGAVSSVTNFPCDHPGRKCAWQTEASID